MKNIFAISLSGAIPFIFTFLAHDGFGQATQSNNTVGPPAYLGWNSTSNISLKIAHQGQRPIFFETNLRRRMTLYDTGQLGIPNYAGPPPQNEFIGIGTTGNLRNTAMEIFSGDQPVMNDKIGMLIEVQEAKGIQYGLRAYSIGNNPGNYSNVGVAAFVGGQSTSGLSIAILGNALTTCSGNEALAGQFDGDVFVTELTGPSDVHLKDNIENISNTDIDNLKLLSPKSYVFNQGVEAMNLPQERQYGLVAQDVDSLFPNMVSEVAHPADINEENEISNEPVTYLGVEYFQFIPLLTSGWQRQELILSNQQERMALLDAQLTAIESQLYSEINARKINVSNQVDAFAVYPNPVEDFFTVEVDLTKPSQGSVKLYNATMQLVDTYLSSRLSSGKHLFRFDISAHPRGMYFVVFSTGEDSFTLKLKH